MGRAAFLLEEYMLKVYQENALLNNDDKCSDNFWMLCLTNHILKFCFAESIHFGDHVH